MGLGASVSMVQMLASRAVRHLFCMYLSRFGIHLLFWFLFITLECSEDKLYMCSNDANICVNELQVCDHIEHCPNGTDELEDCLTGENALHIHIHLCYKPLQNVPQERCVL